MYYICNSGLFGQPYPSAELIRKRTAFIPFLLQPSLVIPSHLPHNWAETFGVLGTHTTRQTLMYAVPHISRLKSFGHSILCFAFGFPGTCHFSPFVRLFLPFCRQSKRLSAPNTLSDGCTFSPLSEAGFFFSAKDPLRLFLCGAMLDMPRRLS